MQIFKIKLGRAMCLNYEQINLTKFNYLVHGIQFRRLSNWLIGRKRSFIRKVYKITKSDDEHKSGQKIFEWKIIF